MSVKEARRAFAIRGPCSTPHALRFGEEVGSIFLIFTHLHSFVQTGDSDTDQQALERPTHQYGWKRGGAFSRCSRLALPIRYNRHAMSQLLEHQVGFIVISYFRSVDDVITHGTNHVPTSQGEAHELVGSV